MDIQRTLERIKFNGEQTPDLRTLDRLQRQFLKHVPFENLYIHQDTPFDLSTEALYHKIVEQRKGGVCFELNSFFYDLLERVGYQVAFLEAQMYDGKPIEKPFTHMTLKVTIGGDAYIVDVGNGRFFGKPLSMQQAIFSNGEEGRCLIAPFDETYHALYVQKEEMKLVPRYVFSLDEKKRDDFSEASHFIQTSPETHFTQKIIVTIPTEEGRVTLSNNQLIRTTRTEKRTEEILSEKQFYRLLWDIFGIEEKYLFPKAIELQKLAIK